MRTSKEKLKARLVLLNRCLGRPTEMWSPGAMSNQMNVGHLTLDSNDYGYMICEILSSSGAEQQWSPRLKAGEMNLYMQGLERGITLRNASENKHG